jgi:hypothetical protein
LQLRTASQHSPSTSRGGQMVQLLVTPAPSHSPASCHTPFTQRESTDSASGHSSKPSCGHQAPGVGTTGGRNEAPALPGLSRAQVPSSFGMPPWALPLPESSSAKHPVAPQSTSEPARSTFRFMPSPRSPLVLIRPYAARSRPLQMAQLWHICGVALPSSVLATSSQRRVSFFAPVQARARAQ